MKFFKELYNDKEKTFWFLQISGWGIFYFQYVLVFSPISELTFNTLISRSITFIIGFSLSVILRYRFKKIDFRKHSFYSLSVIIIVSSFISSAIWSVSAILIYELIMNMQFTFGDASLWYIIVGIFRNNIVFIGWSGLYFGIKFWMEWILQKEKTEKALLLASNAQFEMLRYQLNPHFLFNTLSSLRALTSENNTKVKELITKISEFLRYTLTEVENNEVPLSEEIEVIKNYLGIEKVRFEDDLVIDFNIDSSVESYPIPILLIHPLVENAIKHGMQTSPIPLKIIISATDTDGFLNISVFNTGKWIERESTVYHGKGIENIKRRLEIFSPNQHDFKIIKNQETVIVEMSFKKATE
jgi:two-component system, LytTR family, sensor kinase